MSVAPSGGFVSFCRPYPGLTPQAKNMPRLRRSNQGVTPERLHGGSTSGANLLQHLASCTLDLGSCIRTRTRESKPLQCVYLTDDAIVSLVSGAAAGSPNSSRVSPLRTSSWRGWRTKSSRTAFSKGGGRTNGRLPPPACDGGCRSSLCLPSRCRSFTSEPWRSSRCWSPFTS